MFSFYVFYYFDVLILVDMIGGPRACQEWFLFTLQVLEISGGARKTLGAVLYFSVALIIIIVIFTRQVHKSSG